MPKARTALDRAPVGLRFAHGAVFSLKSDSLSDYLLAPIFLKFIAISVAVIVLLQDHTTLAPHLGVTLVFEWVFSTAAFLTALFFLGAVGIALKNVGAIKTIYTPLVCLPSMLVAEYMAQAALNFFWGIVPAPSSETLFYESRLCAVVLLLDVLYGSFVAQAHPQTAHSISPSVGSSPALTTHPFERSMKPPALGQGQDLESFENWTEDKVDDAVLSRAPPPEEGNGSGPAVVNGHRPAPKIRIRENIRPAVVPRPAIQIGSDRVVIDTLVAIKAEDHYLKIITLEGNRITRGKLGTFVDQSDPDLGVQVSRSVWLARTQIACAKVTSARSMTIQLKDGGIEPVARARLSLVKDCLKRWNIALRDERSPDTSDQSRSEANPDQAA